MIKIDHRSYQKDNNDDDHDNGNRTVEIEERRRRECEEREERERFGERDCCEKKVKAPVVLAPLVAVTGGSTVIGAYPDRVAIQILNNAAVLATYTIVLQSLPRCEEGYVVIETAEGITLLTVIGANNVSPTALTTAGSYITLKWTGETWTQI